jgi:hypothetical protein
VKLDAKLLGPPLKVLEIVAKKTGRRAHDLPDPLPPGLLGVFERQLHLRSDLAQRDLGIAWTPYEQVLRESAAWFKATHPRQAQREDVTFVTAESAEGRGDA